MKRKASHAVPTSTAEPTIDFSSIKGSERFEHLARALLDSMGLTPRPSGRGPDEGWDFIVYETFDGPISREYRRKWIIQCKHLAASDKAVQRSDIQTAVLDAITQGASGYLLITSTVASASTMRTIATLIQERAVNLEIEVWDRDILEQKLLEERHRPVLKRFFEKVADKLSDPVVSLVARARSLGFGAKEISLVAGAAALGDLKRLDLLDRVILQPVREEGQPLRAIWLDLAGRDGEEDAGCEEIAVLAQGLADAEFASFLERLPEIDFIPNRETLLAEIAKRSPSERRLDVLHTLLAEFDVYIEAVYDLLQGLNTEQLKLVLEWAGLEDRISDELTQFIMDDPPSSIYDYSSRAFVDEVFVTSYDPDTDDGQLTVHGTFEVYLTLQNGSDSDVARGDGEEFSATATGKYCAAVSDDGSVTVDVLEFEFDPCGPDSDDEECDLEEFDFEQEYEIEDLDEVEEDDL